MSSPRRAPCDRDTAEHAELFWGLRGGGGNFGVVTSFEYQLHPVGPVLAGLVLYPFSKAKEALTLYRDFAAATPDEVNTIGALLTSPDGAPVAAIAVCCQGVSRQRKRFSALCGNSDRR